jgi:hypothetical protein
MWRDFAAKTPGPASLIMAVGESIACDDPATLEWCRRELRKHGWRLDPITEDDPPDEPAPTVARPGQS